MTAEGRIVETYDKHHLVPFGEYIPFKKLLPISSLAGRLDFSAGTGRRTLAVPGLPAVTPLICYEAVFPGRAKPDQLRDRPGWLLNITNDAWFGISTGPYQHFAKAIFRAVETNLYVLRSANKGISAIINNKGLIIKKLEPFEAGNIELEVPLIKNENRNRNDLIFFVLLITYIFIFRIYKTNK